jgi:hypothetical protein
MISNKAQEQIAIRLIINVSFTISPLVLGDELPANQELCYYSHKSIWIDHLSHAIGIAIDED